VSGLAFPVGVTTCTFPLPVNVGTFAFAGMPVVGFITSTLALFAGFEFVTTTVFEFVSVLDPPQQIVKQTAARTLIAIIDLI